nr:hypothetical protein [Spirochaetota bacterium]
MFENVTPLYSKLFGSADEFTLEHRFLNSTTLFICVFCFVACFVNLSINCGPIMTYGMLLLSAIYGYLYYLSRIQKYYIWPSRATVALILINCIQLWFMNGGSIGAGQYVIFPGLCASIVLVSTRFKIPIILFYAVLLALLLTIEHVHPEIIQVYNSADDRFIDIIITFTLSLLLTTIVLYTLSMNYYDHRRIIAKRNREIEIELELARNIQKSLLPEMKPASKSLEMYGYFLPMDKVGGDFYDFYELESSIIVSIYDVSGHGVPAAFLGVIAKSALKDAVSKEQSTSS